MYNLNMHFSSRIGLHKNSLPLILDSLEVRTSQFLKEIFLLFEILVNNHYNTGNPHIKILKILNFKVNVID